MCILYSIILVPSYPCFVNCAIYGPLRLLDEEYKSVVNPTFNTERGLGMGLSISLRHSSFALNCFIVWSFIFLFFWGCITKSVSWQIRDTSVLVRLRPAWEDLRSYLTARGRKRFEVYVCTMAERDYALEMWRLLDPDSNLINSKELLDRIVCVKSGKFLNYLAFTRAIILFLSLSLITNCSWICCRFEEIFVQCIPRWKLSS